MNLYHISQNVNNGWNTFDFAVVCAESEEKARFTHPSGYKNWDGTLHHSGDWCAVTDVKVRLIGLATEDVAAGVICASFNVG